MDQDQTERMTPFDELVTSPTLQIMKLLIPYTPFSGRRMLASFIKFTELQRTIRLFGQRSLTDPFSYGNKEQDITSPLDLIGSFRPYLNQKDAEMLDTFINLKEMMSFMEMMQPQGNQGNDSLNPADLFSGIFPADLQEQFHMYSDLFSSIPQNQEHNTPDFQNNAHKTQNSTHETQQHTHETQQNTHETLNSTHETQQNTHETPNSTRETQQHTHETLNNTHKAQQNTHKTQQNARDPQCNIFDSQQEKN